MIDPRTRAAEIAMELIQEGMDLRLITEAILVNCPGLSIEDCADIFSDMADRFQRESEEMRDLLMRRQMERD